MHEKLGFAMRSAQPTLLSQAQFESVDPMCSDIRIRTYAPADEAALMALVLELQAIEGQWSELVRPASEMGPWYVADVTDQCAKDQGTILIAGRDGQVAG